MLICEKCKKLIAENEEESRLLKFMGQKNFPKDGISDREVECIDCFIAEEERNLTYYKYKLKTTANREIKNNILEIILFIKSQISKAQGKQYIDLHEWASGNLN